MDLTYLSLGAGVQSTTIYLLAVNGDIDPRPDVAIFTDTQQEPPWVYQNINLLRKLGNIPIEIVSAGDLGDAIDKARQGKSAGRFSSIPFWMESENGLPAPARRHCTRDYKIEPIRAHVRQLLGLSKRQRASGRFQVEEWLGISLDEIQRARASRDAWVKTRWPLIEKRWRRHHCIQYLESISYPIPAKSACIFCPYRTDLEYAKWKQRHPEIFALACQWDKKIRESGPLRGMRQSQYISRSLKPLDSAVSIAESHADQEPELFDGLVDECDGMCGT